MKTKVKQNNQKGIALLEMAIGMTVFLTIVFGVIEFGRALWTHNALADAARRGAHYAVNNRAISSDAVKNVVVYGDPAGGTTPLLDNLTVDNVTVQYSGFSLNTGTVSVSITNYQFRFVIPLIGTTINMPAYATTLTGENVGLVPADL
jgi:Flp pilus assembly protein TadG